MLKVFFGALKNLRFPLLIACVIWLKTYVATVLKFNLTVDTPMRQFILFISPLAMSLLFVGIALLFSGKKRNFMLTLVNLFLTSILVGNILFYGFFNDFVTLPILLQTNNAANLGSSVRELANPLIYILFMDIIFFIIMMKKFPNFTNPKKIEAPIKGLYFLLTAAVFTFNLGLAQMDRPQLLTRSFDRDYLVRYMGVHFYQIYDVFLSTRSSAQRAMASGDQLTEVKNFIRSNNMVTDSPLHGAAEGKNIIAISLESFQTFVLGAEINGEEVTPFLNEFIDRSYFFENFYHQTAQGKTADSELLAAASLHPLNRGAVFFTHPTNEFITTPDLLRQEGYYTAMVHANNASFWNRNVMYSTLGFDTFYSIRSFDVNDQNSIGWGLSDISFFEQSIDILREMPEPFYAKFITLTNHFPYEIDESRMMIEPFNSGVGSFDRFFQTVRYQDEALRVFIEGLKESGLYDNSIIIMYGDHYGQSENRHRPMAYFLGKDEITDADHIELQRVPFIVHFPGQTEGEVFSTVSGQIDIKPTLMSLLGIETSANVTFGNDVFSSGHPNMTIFREGSFVTASYIFRNGTFFSKETREEIDPPENAEQLLNRMRQELYYSDRIILGNLLRFYDGNVQETGTHQTELR